MGHRQVITGGISPPLQTHHSTMKIKIEFSTDNAAFDEHIYEPGRILRELALVIKENESGTLRDINGNTVGAWSWT